VNRGNSDLKLNKGEKPQKLVYQSRCLMLIHPLFSVHLAHSSNVIVHAFDSVSGIFTISLGVYEELF